MAIKRTITRQYGVRPVQMDTSSGALALAQASQNVANTISNVTKFVDDNQFQEAVLKAEIAGRQVGSQTIQDKNGNTIPKPLDQNTLNSFTADIYNKANIRKAQEYYKKEAINSYGLALQNHAVAEADMALAKNGGKINDKGKLIVDDFKDKYIDGIKGSIAPQVFDIISPALSKIWGQASRKASAIQIKEVRETQLFEATKYSEQLLAMETNLITNGTADEQEYEFIEREKARVFSIIDDNASSKQKSKQFQLAYNQSLQQNVSSNAVDLAYEAGVSIPDLLVMAFDTGKTFANDPNIDGIKIQKVMESKIAFYDKLDTENREKMRMDSSDLFSTLGLKILLNETVSENDISKMLLPDQLRFQKLRAAQLKLSTTQDVKDFNDNISNRLLALSFGDIKPAKPTDENIEVDGIGSFDTPAQLKKRAIVNEMNELVRLIGHKDTTVSVRSNIYKTLQKVHQANLAMTKDAFRANMEKMFTGSGGVVAQDPSTLLSFDYIQALKSKGFIGPDKKVNAYTEEDWVKRVSTYAKDWQKAIKKTHMLSQVGSFINNGVVLPKEHKVALEEIIGKTINVNGQVMPHDIFSDNEDVREKSIESLTKHAIAYKYIPQYAKNVFESIQTLEGDAFNHAKRLYESIKSAFMKDTPSNDSFFQQIAGDNVSGVNIQMMESAMFYRDSKTFLNVNSPKSANRNLSDIYPNSTLFGGTAKSEAEVFDLAAKEVFDTIDDNWFVRFFSNGVGGQPYESKVVDKFFAQSGVDNMEEAIFKEPLLKSEMMKYVKYQIAQGSVTADEKGLKVAIKHALYKFSGNMSLQEDRNGKIYLTRGVDIVKASQSNVPDGMGFLVTKDIINADVLSKYKQTFSVEGADPQLKEAIENGKFLYISNNNRVGNPTYRVVAETEDSRMITIADGYSFNYEGSQLQSDYTEAKQKISNGGVRSVFGYFDFMSQNNIKAVMESIDSNRDYTKGLASLFAGYNNMANTLGLKSISLPSVSNYLASDLGKKEVQEFFDNYRLIRFDLR